MVVKDPFCEVSVSSSNITHPLVQIEESPISDFVKGTGNVFSELVCIKSTASIGSNNLFETGTVGDGCLIGTPIIDDQGVKAVINENAVLGDNITVSSGCKVCGIIPSNTIVFNNGAHRVLADPAANKYTDTHKKHIDYLRNVLPLYHNTV